MLSMLWTSWPSHTSLLPVQVNILSMLQYGHPVQIVSDFEFVLGELSSGLNH